MDETQLEDFIIIGLALVLLVAIALIIPAGQHERRKPVRPAGLIQRVVLAAHAP